MNLAHVRPIYKLQERKLISKKPQPRYATLSMTLLSPPPSLCAPVSKRQAGLLVLSGTCQPPSTLAFQERRGSCRQPGWEKDATEREGRKWASGCGKHCASWYVGSLERQASLEQKEVGEFCALFFLLCFKCCVVSL